LNYAHFGLALVAILKLVQHRRSGKGSIVFDAGLVGLTLVVVASIAANGSHVLRGALFWMSIIEPFVFLALMGGMEEAPRRRLRTYLFALAAIQLPFVAYQFLLYGTGDKVQGTLMGQGAGHHVLGGIGVIAAVVLIASSRREDPFRLVRWALALVLFSLGYFSGARQVYFALAFAAVPVALSLFHRRVLWMLPWLLTLGMVSASIIVAWGPRLPPALAQYSDVGYAQTIVERKLHRMLNTIREVGWRDSFLGLGPGNGLSRVALTTVPEYGDVPSVIVGTEPARLARKYIIRLSDIPQSGKSSVSSPYASWLGIYTDVGLLGMAMFLVLCAWAWGTLSSARPDARRWGRLLLLLAAVLGALFTWLEEPAFTVYLAVAIGTFLISARKGRATSPEPRHTLGAPP
jgi:hypothetical protein